MLKIDKKLNLVIPIVRDGETFGYVHSMPISHAIFRQFFLLISKTFSAIYSEGLNTFSGPRVAAMLLEDIAKNMGRWDGPTGAEACLAAEIRRLSNVVAPGASGWTCVPFEGSNTSGLLTDEEYDEAEGLATFFTVNCAVAKANYLPQFLASSNGLWGTQTTSLNVTAFIASLPTSTGTASTGETPPAAAVVSVPY